MDQQNFSDAKSILSDIKHIPYGLQKSYYAKLGECYFNLRNFELSRESYNKAFNTGLISKHFLYLNSKYENNDSLKNDFFLLLRNDFDSVVNNRNTMEYRVLKNKILEIISTDQSVRSQYLNFSEKSDDEKKKLLNAINIQDSVNQSIFDSICDRYGWINKIMVFDVLKNPHIVLYHSSENKRYSYIAKGYKLANQNLIDWQDVISLQSYSIGKDLFANMDTCTIIPELNSTTLKKNKAYFDFVIYCLGDELTDGGTVMGNPKKVQIFARYDTKKNKAKRLLKYIDKVLAKYKIDSSFYLINSDSFLKDLNGMSNVEIGLKFI
jgi:hypothetical protein